MSNNTSEQDFVRLIRENERIIYKDINSILESLNEIKELEED